MSILDRKRDDVIDDLEQQVSSLTRELAGLRRNVAKRGAGLYDDVSRSGSHVYGDVSDLVAELVDRFVHRAPGSRRALERRARLAGDAVRDHPRTAAVAGLVVLGLAAALLMRR